MKPGRPTAAEAAISAEKAQIALLKRQERAARARDDFLTFIKFTMPDPEDPNDLDRSMYRPAKHHVAICEAIEQFVKGEMEGVSILILTMPPRHGKTRIVSMQLPAWLMGRRPQDSVIGAAYSDDFAQDYGAEVRRIMATPQYKLVFPEARLIRGGTAKDRLQTTRGGMGTFVGRGGTMTGRGGHIMIGDDLIKNADDARSKTIRDQIWEWFTTVFMTRRMGRKLVILTFTRWHSDDPIGRLTDENNEHFNPQLAEKIRIINFPAIAEEDDTLGRAPGEALWPEEHSLDSLLEQRMLDRLAFSALYQQRPTPEDGDLFTRETLKFYDELPEDLRIYAASDHAVGTDQRNDPTCMVKAGVDRNGNLFLLPDLFWKRAKADAVVEVMLEMGSGAQAPLIWWAEKGHISKSIGPFLRKRMDQTGRYFNVVEVTPASDKVQRAQSISAIAALGKLYLPRNAWWTEKAVAEMLAFPNGLHDDFVDTIAYLGLGLRSQINAGPAVAARRPVKTGTLGWLKQEQRHQELERARASWGGY